MIPIKTRFQQDIRNKRDSLVNFLSFRKQPLDTLKTNSNSIIPEKLHSLQPQF